MHFLKKILKKLFDRKYIDKETKEKNDYDLLTEILKKRQKNKNQLRILRQKNMELDAFHEIISETDDLFYTEKELNYIYENILD